jgi:hypothetical protein
MKYTILFIIMVISTSIFGQINQNYIKNELIKRKWLVKATFEPGYYIKQKDTVFTDILAFKNKDKMNSYLFCVIKERNDSIHYFTADEIKEYKVGKSIFKKATSVKEIFFIKQIKTGTVNLFERDPIPSDSKFLYYLKKKNQQGYFEICPDESNFFIYENNNQNQNQNQNQGLIETRFFTNNNIERFKLFVSTYFINCEKVRNMVNADIYTISDIPSIVESYNQCFKNN